MDAFRDLTAAKQSAIQHLSNNVTHANASIITESQIYNGVQGMPPQHGGAISLRQGLPSGNDLVSQFQRPKHNRPMPLQAPPMGNTMTSMQQQMVNNELHKHFKNKVNMSKNNENSDSNGAMMIQQGAGPMQMIPRQMPMMSYGPPPEMVNFHSRMYDNFVHGASMMQQNQFHPHSMQQPMQQPMQQTMQQAIRQKTEAQHSKHQSKNEISTNGDSEMKDEKTVENELSNLNPTDNDVRAINNLLNATQNDPKMQNSQFFNLLKKIREKPTVPEQHSANGNFDDGLGNQWNEEFADWKNDNRLNDASWQSYLDSINPTKPQDPQYGFAEKNHFISESNETSETSERTDVKKSDEYFAEGLRLMKEGNLNEAILAFEACVKIESSRSEAWRYLGICHADNENENSGIAAFLKCIENDPYDLDALLQLGVSYTNEIDPYRALKYLRNWIANHADYAKLNDSTSTTSSMDEKIDNNSNNSSHTWMGSRREHGRIVDLFNKAIEINGNDADLHIVLGVLYNITSDYDKAEIHFKKAIQARPKDASLWNKLGATQANGQRCNEAIKAYSRALQLKPNYVRALSNLGISFANQGMHREACQSYLASLQRNPSAESVWDHLTMSLMHMNRSDLVALCDKRDPKLFKNYFEF